MVVEVIGLERRLDRTFELGSLSKQQSARRLCHFVDSIAHAAKFPNVEIERFFFEVGAALALQIFLHHC